MDSDIILVIILGASCLGCFLACIVLSALSSESEYHRGVRDGYMVATGLNTNPDTVDEVDTIINQWY